MSVVSPVVALSILALGTQDSPVETSGYDAARFDPAHTVTLRAGDITLVVGDHYEHENSGRENYEGIHHLSHRLRSSNVFCPLYAGMIGVRQPCQIEQVDESTARITKGDGDDRVVETFKVVPPHYIDYEVQFTAPSASGIWNNTSYMNGPADPGIYVRKSDGAWVRHYSEKHGFGASVAPEGMNPLPPVTPVKDSPYPHGSALFHEGFCGLRYDPRFPVYYGRFDDMVLIFMMPRELGPYFVPYMSPTGGGHSAEFNRPNPAWDHRFHLRDLTPGQRVIIQQRLCYKRYVDNDDVVREYELWCASRER
ncbi:MAG: hypothetical protein AMXMBFR4_06250 [Candidatus Hydrogenedentota bacterium]